MKLVIIEPDYHAEVLNNLCIMLGGSGFKITVVTKEEIFNQLDFNLIEKEEFNWKICPDNKSFKHFFSESFTLLNESDLIFFNTLASDFRYFASLHFVPKVVLRIHNANTFFAPVENIKFKLTPYFIYKDLSHLLRKNLLEKEIKYRKKFLGKVDFVSLPDEIITEYCIQKGYIEKERLTPQIPLTFNQFNEHKFNEKIEITIPGAVDKRRKDYQIVLDILTEVKEKFTEDVVLNLLGRPVGPYGKRMLRLFKALSYGRLTVNCFEERVGESDFVQIMNRSDFLILPLISETRFHIYKEIYGQSKMSGGINDIIRFGKPALISNSVCHPYLQSVSDTFRNKKELRTKLIQWVNNKEYLNIDRSFFGDYKLQLQSKKLSTILKSLITLNPQAKIKKEPKRA